MTQKGAEPATLFLPLEKVVEDFVAMDKETFVRAYPDPCILFDDIGSSAGPEHAGFQTLSKPPPKDGPATTPIAARDRILARLEGGGRVIYPLRRGAKSFASMVTVGRAANNVMRLNVASVSKFHAYFTHVARENSWYVADANSSNGTFIDGQELPPSHGKVPLKSGVTLRFGPDVTGQFYEPAALWQMLHDAVGESAEFKTMPRAASNDAAGAPGA